MSVTNLNRGHAAPEAREVVPLERSQRRDAAGECSGAADAPSSAGEGYGWYRLRSRKYDAIYLSPHMDDAVYSSGGQILLQRAAGQHVLVVTVFGNGSNDEHGQQGHLFRDLAQRKREELAVMDLLDLDFLFLNLPDALHRKHSPSELVRICFPFLPLVPGDNHYRLLASLQALFGELLAPEGRLYFPMAVGSHPDHRVVCDVGRELHAMGFPRIAFYEDVAYVHVKGMLEDRLRSLGVKVDLPFLAFVGGVHHLIYRHAPRWQQWLGWPPGFLFLLVRWLLQRITGLVDRHPEEGDPTVEECDITSTIQGKTTAMRGYTTQTQWAFPPGDALLRELVRSGDRFVERYWSFPEPRRLRAPSPPSTSWQGELKKVEALFRELEAGAAIALGSAFPRPAQRPSHRDDGSTPPSG